jgi:hypothetical protein
MPLHDSNAHAAYLCYQSDKHHERQQSQVVGKLQKHHTRRNCHAHTPPCTHSSTATGASLNVAAAFAIILLQLLAGFAQSAMPSTFPHQQPFQQKLR